MTSAKVQYLADDKIIADISTNSKALDFGAIQPSAGLDKIISRVLLSNQSNNVFEEMSTKIPYYLVGLHMGVFKREKHSDPELR